MGYKWEDLFLFGSPEESAELQQRVVARLKCKFMVSYNWKQYRQKPFELLETPWSLFTTAQE